MLHLLASLRLTLVGIVALATLSMAASGVGFSQTWLALPLSILAINLLAALVTRPVFHRLSGLLVFHLGLLGLLALAAVSALIRMEGRVEIAEGQFLTETRVEITDQGLLHRLLLDRVDFRQGSVTVNYAPGLARRDTVTEIYPEGKPSPVTMSDSQSYDAGHYRFTTTSNKGFAALVSWLDPNGVARGAIHFPSYPAYEWKQINRWTSPDGARVELELALPALPRKSEWTLRSPPRDVSLIVRRDGEPARYLQPGQSVSVGPGTLRFDNVRLWIGYEIDFSPLSGWMFGAGCVAIVGIACHFRRRLFPGKNSPVIDRKILPGGVRHADAN